MIPLIKFLCGILLLSSHFCFAGELSVAVAGNFFKPLKVLAAQFESQTGHKVELVVAATGKLYAQISNGAPFEVFLAADQKRPTKLVEQKLAVKESQFTYAKGKLVLWSPEPHLIGPQGLRLESPDLLYLAIANPKTAPYGEQAIRALKNLGVYQYLQDKLVEGQNISQAFQYVSTGNVRQGILALSQVTMDGQITSGSAWVIPSSLYQTIQQDAVLLNKGKDNPAAREFLDYLKTAAAKRVIRAFGYEVDA